MGEMSIVEDTMSFKKGFKDGLPLFFGYIPLSIAFGVAATKMGMAFWLSNLMNMLLYSATGQFTTLNLIEGGETIILTYAFTLFVVNCRYILLGMSLAQKLHPSMNLLQRILFAPFNTDEIFGIAVRQKSKIKASYMFGLATLPYIGWLVGVVIGCLFTNFLPESISSAMGIILFAVFIAIIVPPLRNSKPIVFVVLLAMIISVLLECNPIIKNAISSPGIIIMICAISASLMGAIFFPEEGEPSESSDKIKKEENYDVE